METSLQNASHVTADELHESLAVKEAEEEQHIHLPSPSFWPFILSAAILLTIVGLLALPDIPWLSIVAAPFILVGILGWALEDPMASTHEETPHKESVLPPTAQEVLEQAQDVADRTVTVSSTAWSAHPVRVEAESVESEGVVLALYGKVELEAQRRELEEVLRKLPHVVDVKNFIVAEDSILNIAYKRLENLRSQSKLEGARNIEILVENYILSLYGEVPTNDMKYMLEREMIGIPGVRVVVNHIGLNEDIPGNLGKTRNKI